MLDVREEEGVCSWRDVQFGGALNCSSFKIADGRVGKIGSYFGTASCSSSFFSPNLNETETNPRLERQIAYD